MSNARFDLEDHSDILGDRAQIRLLYVSTAKYGGDWHSMLHTHACTELFYVVGGQGQFRIEDQLHPVFTDDLVIVNPNVAHTEVSINASPLEYIVLGVTGMALSVDSEDRGRYHIVNFRDGNEDILLCLRSMLRELTAKQSGYEMVCQDLLEILMVRLKRRTNFTATLSPVSKPPSKECAAVRRYIDANYKESLTLDILAKEAHLNKYHMAHAFTKEYGISPISYLISRRIQESRHLLRTTDHSLSQICQMLGFSSPSYFSQSFRKAEGMSPMEYRKKSRGE